MKLKILSSAIDDLYEARLFYERQGEGLGDYFFDSLFSDIDSLTLYGGMHSKFHGYHRMLCEAVTARNPKSCILTESSKVKGERMVSFEL